MSVSVLVSEFRRVEFVAPCLLLPRQQTGRLFMRRYTLYGTLGLAWIVGLISCTRDDTTESQYQSAVAQCADEAGSCAQSCTAELDLGAAADHAQACAAAIGDCVRDAADSPALAACRSLAACHPDY